MCGCVCVGVGGWFFAYLPFVYMKERKHRESIITIVYRPLHKFLISMLLHVNLKLYISGRRITPCPVSFEHTGKKPRQNDNALPGLYQ